MLRRLSLPARITLRALSQLNLSRYRSKMAGVYDDPISVFGEVSTPQHGGVVGLGPGPTLESAVMTKMVLQVRCATHLRCSSSLTRGW